nr:uncharacterized protein LOC115269234 [Aedes albopictus]
MPMSTRSAKSAIGGTSRCQVCNNPDTERMVSCGQCTSLWHFQCVGVDDEIVDPVRTFACPKCQQPLVSTAAGKKTTNTGKSTSKHSSVPSERTSSSARARRAQLQMEKLEAQKALALKRLELGDVSSQQSSRSKVEQWQQKQNEMLSLTIVTTAATVTEAELQEGIATTSRIGASQGGETQPAGDVLGEPADDEEEFASGRSDTEEEEDENDTSVESHEDATLTENIDAVERPLNAPRGPSSTSTPIRVSSRLNKGVPPFRFRETSSLPTGPATAVFARRGLPPTPPRLDPEIQTKSTNKLFDPMLPSPPSPALPAFLLPVELPPRLIFYLN